MAGKGGVRSTTWKKGENPTRKPGAKSKVTKVKEAIGLSGWEALCHYIKSDGADKLITEVGKLTGKDYVNAIATLAEFVKPKLQRTEMVGDGGGPVQTTSSLSHLSFEELYKLKYGKKPDKGSD